MTRGIDDLRYVLLQARNDTDPARRDEYHCFLARLGARPQQVRAVDILTERLDDSTMRDADVLLVGGSGEYSVLDDHPPIRRFGEYLREFSSSGVPVFASCFGFQALALALGGEVIHDDEHAEVGTYDLRLTEAGTRDPLFSAFPRQFKAQLGHKDRVARLPEGLQSLAQSDLSPNQAFRLPDLPVYATQFHAELDWRENRRRFEGYMDTYGRLFGEQEAIRKLNEHEPSPEANGLIRDFVEHFAL